MSFEEYYKSLKLEKYPFSIYSTEAERKQNLDIYLQPGNYSVIKEGIKNSSVIIIGERGSGKTALNDEICKNTNNETTLLVQINDFDNINADYTSDQLYSFFIENIANVFFTSISKNQNYFWKYSKEERIDFSMYLDRYVSSSTKDLLKEKIKNIQNSFIKKWGLRIYNISRVTLNYGLKAATKVASDSLTKHFSALPEFDSGDSEYFKKIESEIDQSFTTDQKSYFYLNKLNKLILMHKYEEIILIIDKIDDDERFKNDAEPISKFIEGIASNNKVLENSNFKVALFSWSTPFNYIKSNVRTQRLTIQQLEWNNSSLENALNKRLFEFSNKNILKIGELFEDEAYLKISDIYDMSNNSPRDLWHILDKCIKVQYKLDTNKKITSQAVVQGIEEFVLNFNYYEYYPKKRNARTNDVYAYIKHLLKLDEVRFTKTKLSTMAGTGGKTNNFVVAMENMGLIIKTRDKLAGGFLIYEIKDPKVKYALKNNIDIAKV